MKKLALYVETSVFGFCFDKLERNSEKQEAATRLFESIGAGLVAGYVSGLTLEEISQAPEPLRRQMLALVRQARLKTFEIDLSEVEELAQAYLDAGIIPPEYGKDALHIAYAVVGEFDVLVTFNCEHIANEFKLRKIKAASYANGYFKEPTVRTPLEVMWHEG